MANFFLDNKDLQFHLNHPLMKKIVELRERGYADKGKYDYAPVDFEDAMDSYRRVMEICGEICGDVLAPNAEGVDHDGPRVVDDHVVYASGTAQNIEALNQAGLFGMTIPRQYGGLNFPLPLFAMANEMVARADAGFENIWGLQDCAETLNEFASEEIKARYLPRVCAGETCAMDLTEPDAGSDLQAVMLKAHWDEEKQTWLLNGVKRFITNGDGHISLVLARSEEGTSDARGLSMFVYDRAHMAVKVRRIENKLGIKGSPTCELVFTNAPAELVGDLLLFESQLFGVGQVLPFASPAGAVVFADRLLAQRRFFYVIYDVSLHEPPPFAAYLYVHHVARNGHRDEYHDGVPPAERLALGGDVDDFEPFDERVVRFFSCHFVLFYFLQR